MEEFAERKARLVAQIAAADAPVGLGKDTSNLFRDREAVRKHRLDVREFNHVLAVDADRGWVDVEGMTPYDALTASTLEQGAMPAVVPQLKSITIGGAAAGVGIEASSFKFGLVHDTLLEIEVLTGTGDVIVATPENDHRQLFFGFPNSYGTLGYALRIKARTVPVKKYVSIRHKRHRDPQAYFGELQALAASDIDFLDGTIFAPDEMFITTGRFVDYAPWVSDYTFQNIYYRSLRDRETDYLTVSDFIWRWDTDWFWCSKNLGAQHPIVRRLLGRRRLNSRFYTRLMRWNSRAGLTRTLDRTFGLHRESVIQDVDIPIERAAEFMAFFHREIGILPVWVCPIRARNPSGNFALYPIEEGRMLVNFGFWDVVRRRAPFEKGHHNRLIERKVQELGGIKSLYSDSYFPENEFWRIYNGDAYRELKRRYDPQGVLGDLYRKTVLRH